MAKKKIAEIDAKIALFIKEAGDKSKYNVEQQKIYTAFTRKTGKPINFKITDCEGVDYNVSLDSTKEVKKILCKHYKEKDGTVLIADILNMFDVIRTGAKNYNHGNIVYTKKYTRKGEVYFFVIKLLKSGNNAVLKSFYSNRGYI